MQKILIIEDEESISNEIKQLLITYGYEAIVLDDFKHPLDQIQKINPDLILLDIKLPYLNGELILSNLRAVSNIPVIMLTSCNNEADEVLSMSYGADDYIAKPFNPTILLLRIKAILKRVNNYHDTLNYQDLILIPKKGIVKNQDQEIILTKNELMIFTYLLEHQEDIVTRDELIDDLWNHEEYVNDNTLSVNISRLRNKLALLGYPDIIETRKGVGYRLK